MHYYKSSNEIMQYCIVSNDIALIMHYRALLKRSVANKFSNAFPYLLKGMLFIEKGDHLTNVYVWVIDFVFGQNICLDTCKVPRIIHTVAKNVLLLYCFSSIILGTIPNM